MLHMKITQFQNVITPKKIGFLGLYYNKDYTVTGFRHT
jgi:hypothetical protein